MHFRGWGRNCEPYGTEAPGVWCNPIADKSHFPDLQMIQELNGLGPQSWRVYTPVHTLLYHRGHRIVRILGAGLGIVWNRALCDISIERETIGQLDYDDLLNGLMKTTGGELQGRLGRGDLCVKMHCGRPGPIPFCWRGGNPERKLECEKRCVQFI